MKNNTLILFVDQLRFDAISPYENNEVITPNLEELSKDGNIAENHYCSFPVCTPSRYSFLSGAYTNEHYGWTNHSTLSNCINTFPKEFRKNGYHNVAVGKMHATPTYLDLGFEKMILSEQDGKGRMEDDYHKYLFEKDEIDANDVIDQRQEYRKYAGDEYFKNFGCSKSNLKTENHSTTFIANKAIEEINNWNSEKELLLVSFIKPHHPFDPNEEFIKLYDDKQISLLDGYSDDVLDRDYSFNQGYFDNKTLSREAAIKMTKYYYASITQIDYNIGKIIDKLKEKGLYDTTEIIFTSDHGDYLGYHHLALKSNYMYEPLMHIPLIIKKPNNEKIDLSAISDNTQMASYLLDTKNFETDKSMNEIKITDPREFVLALDRRYFDGKYYNYYMVKNESFKILVNGSFDSILAFDLTKDKNEFIDVSNDKEYELIIQKMKNYLINEILFTSRTISIEEEKSKTVSKPLEECEKQNNIITNYYKEKFKDCKGNINLDNF